MDTLNTSNTLTVGTELTGPTRAITPERIEWYDSAMLSSAKNELAQVGENIHTDHEYAKTQGLDAVNADGMIMTNWCSSMLLTIFGMDYIERGELRTKYIKPVPLGAILSVRGQITAVDTSSDATTTYSMDIWCEDEHQTKLVVGDARITAKRK